MSQREKEVPKFSRKYLGLFKLIFLLLFLQLFQAIGELPAEMQRWAWLIKSAEAVTNAIILLNLVVKSFSDVRTKSDS